MYVCMYVCMCAYIYIYIYVIEMICVFFLTHALHFHFPSSGTPIPKALLVALPSPITQAARYAAEEISNPRGTLQGSAVVALSIIP